MAGAAALLAALVCLLMACIAQAADRIYWPNFGGTTISFANLDGSGGGNLGVTGAAKVEFPLGVAVDPVAGRIYWGNFVGTKISFANLDGSGADTLSSGAASVDQPTGFAIDPVAGRIYWANHANANNIAFANLNGPGGGDLATGAAPLGHPEGVAIDPVGRRIYWANRNGNAISFANLDGSGGGELPTGSATVSAPAGVAVDPIGGRVYWSNLNGNAISFANLNGSGGEDLNTTGATVISPRGVVADPIAGRLYWANAGSISSANLDNTGHGADLNLGEAGLSNPQRPALFLSPRPTAPPLIGGGASAGSVLSCSEGTWASNLIETFYEAPFDFAFQWSRDGSDIAGANQRSVTASAGGEYRCRVTAQNHAGTSTQTSGPHRVSAASVPSIRVTLTLLGRAPARGPLKVRVTNGSAFAITGTLAAQTSKAVAAAHHRRVKLHAAKLSIAAGGERTLSLALPKPLQQILARRHKLSLALSATVEGPGGSHGTVSKTGVVKLQARKSHRGPR